MAEGLDVLELSTVIKGEARFFSFTVDEEKGKTIASLELPPKARVICYYRKGAFSFADDETKLLRGDEVVILTHSENVDDLRRRWQPAQADDGES
jgi:trk system potassium uptake protein TrkA